MYGCSLRGLVRVMRIFGENNCCSVVVAIVFGVQIHIILLVVIVTYICTCTKLLLFSCVARGAVTIAGAADAAATIRGCCCADGVRFALVRSEKERKSLNQSKSKQVASLQYNARENKN